MIRTYKVPTITGNSNDTSDKPLNGRLLAIYVEYLITPNAATDVTIATLVAPIKTLLTITNNATSGWYYPREVLQDTAGATITFDATNEIYGAMPISDHVKVTVAQGDADQTVTVWLLLEQ